MARTELSGELERTTLALSDAKRGGPLVSLASFKEAHRGATILVCGCGESLNELQDPTPFITIGVNDIGRLFDPTYLVVVNPRSQFKADRFRFVEQSRAQYLFTQLDLGRADPPVVKFTLGKYGGTEIGDGDALPYTQNSPYVAMCLAAYMGARRIGLIGVDFTDHHFFAHTGRHPLAGRLQEIDAQYGRLAVALRERGVELVNLSTRSRLTSLPKADWSWLDAATRSAQPPAAERSALRIVSYATTPVAGVPAVLARCIAGATANAARCVWARSGYGNGVGFAGDVEWTRQPRAAAELLEAADVVIVHNGKVGPKHVPLLQGKRVVTMAHNYGWNVDMRFVQYGGPGLVVGQYQATLPEFSGWTVVPNPIPLWEPEYSPGDKGEAICIAYTPSGRHERYPPGHRLYWHGKGFQTTIDVLQRLARLPNVRIESTGHGQVDHAEALAMKRRAHIVIDECVTGSYHRNSLEGLAAGCVVVNGVGLLPGVEDMLRRCAPETDRLPFVFSSLDGLEETLRSLIGQGSSALAAQGRANRTWMERHWSFAEQWSRFWQAACEPQPASARTLSIAAPAAARPSASARPARIEKERSMATPTDDLVSVIIPHGGSERLPHLAATLATLRQREGIREIIVAEMGPEPLALDVARRWADKHLFIEHGGPFERARALNAAEAVADGELLLWHDNDILIPHCFVPRAVQELRARGLDYLIPYTSLRYLSPTDTQRVMQGVADPQHCRPGNVLGARAASGGIGLANRTFVRRHGGFIEGFLGWGGEDNAWFHKVAVLGTAGRTRRGDQHLHHLYHPASGGHLVGRAAAENPHYAANVALLNRVLAVRQAAELGRLFPRTSPAAGVLTRSGTLPRSPTKGLAVWSYWEGPCPPWIQSCIRTIESAARCVCVLTPEHFDRLRDRDRDIDISRLQVAHRADYVRAFLLHRYGGLWVDADCLVMQSLQPVLDLLLEHDAVGHRERSGLVSNGFLAARPDSRIAARHYERVRAVIRSRRPLGWTSLGSEPLTAVIAEDASGWHELPCQRIQPICWSQPGAFFTERTAEQHAQAYDPQALCYMLSNTQIQRHAETCPGAELTKPTMFFSFLLSLACTGQPEREGEPHETIFGQHARAYRKYRDESISGPGSTLAQTRELRERLPLLLAHLGIRSLLDAPCGDFHWMRHVALGLDRYIGIDIQSEVIAENCVRHGRANRDFVRANLMHDPLPRTDAILCRDLLPHLSFDEIAAVLRTFRRSGATYLLTTTFTGPRQNRDTSAGEWRTLNLTLPPFGFPPPELVINERCTEGGGAYADKSLALWLLADLPLESSNDRCETSQPGALGPGSMLPRRGQPRVPNPAPAPIT